MRQITVLLFAGLGILIIGGGIEIYAYTSPMSGADNESASSTTSLTQVPPPCGGQYQNSTGLTGQPYGCWADNLGYLPAGYVPLPHLPNSATYPCPSEMNASQCRQFQRTCGNGVCDPNESCFTCPVDCGPTDVQTCNLYTGRATSSPAVCQAIGSGGAG
jgi:hypothetical protein